MDVLDADATTESSVADVLRALLSADTLDLAVRAGSVTDSALAAEIDDPDAPRYARPRAAAELREVLLELDDRESRDDPAAEAARLLRQVWP